MTVLLARARGALAAIVRGIGSTLVGPTTITTSTASTATAYSNQRKVDRCQNGVLWAIWNANTNFEMRYSTDNGTTWIASTAGALIGFSGGGTTYTINASMFIDLDDYCHVVYKDRNDGYIYYQRGTPNAARTAWTWSAASRLPFSNSSDYPDIIAHREGSGWTAHIIFGEYASGNSTTQYRPVTVASGGTISVGSAVTLDSNLSVSAHSYPSIDFNHTGDGKTVAGSTPHLYAAWSAGATGSGKGIRFKKATYSGGSWTWGTEREIDSTRYIINSNYWLNCMFDGTRVVIVGQVYDGGASDIVAYDRDAADTATVTAGRVLVDNATNAQLASTGSASYDGDGNLYLFGLFNDGALSVGYRKWTRATTTLGAMVAVDSTSLSSTPYISAKRGFSNSRIEFIYTDGTTSPYNVVYGGIE